MLHKKSRYRQTDFRSTKDSQLDAAKPQTDCQKSVTITSSTDRSKNHSGVLSDLRHPNKKVTRRYANEEAGDRCHVKILYLYVEESGHFGSKRHHQQKAWMWNHIRHQILSSFRRHPAVQESYAKYEELVVDGVLTPGAAADKLLACFLDDRRANESEAKK
ncbi:uncharacterized protein LOC134177279 [Corticium candelabrum]|uniref:uncharacterized protein LOC134177279 n=1 Tax=Corticium candelabrum TaxID=121492 RepID=UPI002E26E947|nr:uncharacterized protein LOC134177279 [Corticium candelabrum]